MRIKFSNFLSIIIFKIKNLKTVDAFKMSSDGQIHVSRRVSVFFLSPPVATLRLKNRANNVPSIPQASCVINFASFDWLKSHRE